MSLPSRQDTAGLPRRRALAAALVLPLAVSLGMLSACSPSPVPRTFILAASATANEPEPVLSAGIAQMLQSAGSASTNATAYIVDPATGQPTVISLTPRRPNGQVDYGPTRGQYLAANIAAVQRVLGDEAARGPFNLLNTIAAAVRVAPPPATLLVLSSGLSTAGGLDMRQVGWDASPASVAAQLKARGLLPNLAGYRVIFSGLADTSGRQPALPLPQRRMLTAIWLAICEASGATSCSTDEMTRPDPPSRSTTPVPVVPVPTVQSVVGPGGTTTTTVPDALLFQFGSSALLPTADSILRPVVTQARSHDLRVSITGYASPDGGTTTYNIALSKRRAEAVSRRLRALSLPAAQIIEVTGAGTAGKSLTACLVRGQLDEAVCAQLRRVVITMSPAPASLVN
jgi:outer membrane protein OmpA-like peptidoglycan-associated protein